MSKQTLWTCNDLYKLPSAHQIDSSVTVVRSLSVKSNAIIQFYNTTVCAYHDKECYKISHRDSVCLEWIHFIDSQGRIVLKNQWLKFYCRASVHLVEEKYTGCESLQSHK